MAAVKTSLTALLASAVFVLSAPTLAQVEVVDASVDQAAPVASSEPQSSAANNTNSQGELFYQLQVMQEEVRMLRGLVEDQGHQLRQLQEQSMQRYIDLDRRIGKGSVMPETKGGKGEANVVAPSQPAIMGEKEAYDNAYRKVAAKEFDAALVAFKTFLEQYPDGKYAPNSYYWMGELYQVVNPKDLEASRQAFTQLLDQYPAHSKAPDAMYKLGKVYFLKGNKTKSRQWLDRVIVDYSASSSSAVDKARQFIRENF